MSIHNKAEEIKGKAKITTGKITDNQRMKLEGQVQKTNAKVNQALEKKTHRPHTDKHDQPIT